MATTAPTDLSVYAARLERLQAEMAAQDVDIVLLGPSSDFFYLTGHQGHTSERLTMLIIQRDGPAQVVVPTLEAPLFADRRELLTLNPWEETEQPTELVAKLVELTGDASGTRIAVGDQLFSIFLLRLQSIMPGAEWVSATTVMRNLRMRKDAREVELLHEAGRRTDEAWMEFITQPIAGLTERQAADRLIELTRKRGLDVHGGICASGPNSASPHHHTGDRVIQAGDAVIFDWGGTLEGYHSDVTRTVHIGEPSEEFKKVYDIVRRANQAALDAVHPGVECQAIDAAARDLITAEGYGDAFIHRVGHGLGLDVHEEPYLVKGNTLPLAEGMVFSDEPGIYLEGRFGVRIEDAVVCTAEGGKRLNEATRDLIIMK